MSARFVAAAKKETQPTEVVRQCSTEMCADAAPRLADSRIDNRKRIDWEQDRVIGVDSVEDVIRELENNFWRYQG